MMSVYERVCVWSCVCRFVPACDCVCVCVSVYMYSHVCVCMCVCPRLYTHVDACDRTYCPPGSGSEDDVALGERCCLKSSVPKEVQSPHWAGLPPRATDPSHSTVSPQCTPHVPPPQPMPYPGDNYTHPRIHQSPDCLHAGGWHDAAGALSYKGWHHVFQGCPAAGGWSHSASQDLVCKSGR